MGTERGEGMTAARWQCLNSWLLLGFVALLIVVPWGYAAVPLIATGAAILGAPGVNGRLVRLDSEDAWWCVVLLIFAGIWLMDVWETGHWPQTEEGEGIALPIWPALAAGLLVWLRCHEPAACHWWLGICAGALGACVVALYDRLVLAQPRAGIEINAIPFGNLALLLGFLSLMAVLWWSCRGPRGGRSRWLLSLALLGALSGFLASLLSGTRGGWVAVPCLAGLFAFSWWRMPSPGVRRLVPWKGLVTGIGLLLVVVMIPQTGVSGRRAGTECLGRRSAGRLRGGAPGDVAGRRDTLLRATLDRLGGRSARIRARCPGESRPAASGGQLL